MNDNILDLTGQRFGKLVVLGRIDADKVDTSAYIGEISNDVMYLCRCDCGYGIILPGSVLSTGYKTDCGCALTFKGMDLRGMRFGKLTVMGLSSEIRGKDRMWICKCDCGNTHLARGHQLKSGEITTCGCSRQKLKDIIGEKRGHLTAIGYTDKRDSRGSAIYIWQCDCGNTVERAIQSVHNNGSAQCPECQRKVKQRQAEDIRNRIERDPDTNLSITALNSIREGVPTASSSTGVRGVSYHQGKGKYKISARENGKQVYLGDYDTLEEAKVVREAFVRRVYGVKGEEDE